MTSRFGPGGSTPANAAMTISDPAMAPPRRTRSPASEVSTRQRLVNGLKGWLRSPTAVMPITTTASPTPCSQSSPMKNPAAAISVPQPAALPSSGVSSERSAESGRRFQRR